MSLGSCSLGGNVSVSLVAYYVLCCLALAVKAFSRATLSCGRVGWEANSGNVRERSVTLFLCVAMVAAIQPWLYLCVLSSSWSLGSASPHTDCSGRKAHCVSLLLWAQEVLTGTWLFLCPKNPQWALGWIHGTYLCSSPFPPLGSLTLTHLQMFQCADISDMFVFGVEKSFIDL